MNTLKLYSFYFLIGVIGSISIQMLPLVMSAKNFDPTQVATIVSFVYLAALFQPIVGYLTRFKFGSHKMIQTLLIIVLITSFLTFYSYNYYLIIVIVLLFSVARASISPIFDSITTSAANKGDVNYGLARSGASLGFGVGMAIYTAIAIRLNLPYQYSYVFVACLALIGFAIVCIIPNTSEQLSDNHVDNIQPNNTKAALLITIFILYFGALSMRISYQSVYYIEFGYTTSFISLATFIMVIPEIIFLPLYNRLFANCNKILLLYITITLSILQMVMYITFTDYPMLLLITSLLNGLQIMIFVPTYFSMLHESLGEKNSAIGFILNITLQSLFVGVFNLLVLRQVIGMHNSMIPVFKIIIIVQFCALIPLTIYNYKYKKRP